MLTKKVLQAVNCFFIQTYIIVCNSLCRFRISRLERPLYLPKFYIIPVNSLLIWIFLINRLNITTPKIRRKTSVQTFQPRYSSRDVPRNLFRGRWSPCRKTVFRLAKLDVAVPPPGFYIFQCTFLYSSANIHR